MPIDDMDTEEFKRAVAEAQALGVQLPDEPPTLYRLREMIATKTAEIARTEANKLKGAGADTADGLSGEDDVSDINLDGAFDEVMGETRGVLVRVTSWTEWMPTHASAHEPRLSVEDGLTGFEAGENEKVVSIDTMRTSLLKEVDIEGANGEQTKRYYALYALKAVLAQNVKTTLLSDLIADQDPGDAGRLVNGPGAPSNGLVVTDAAGVPKGGNRAQRRAGGK